MRFAHHRLGRIPITVGLASLVVAALCPARAPAQEMATPVPVQMSVFTKMLAFDRDLPARAGNEIVIGILYQSRYRSSDLAAQQAMQALDGTPEGSIAGLPVRYVRLDYDDRRNLDSLLSHRDVDVLWVAPLRAVDIRNIISTSREQDILTCTGVVDYVNLGMAIGLSIRRDRPLILVNLSAARAEGADLSSELLKLAEIVDSDTVEPS